MKPSSSSSPPSPDSPAAAGPCLLITVNLQRQFLYPQSARSLASSGGGCRRYRRDFHVSESEAIRLLGNDLQSDPLETFCRWMVSIPEDDDVIIVHLKTITPSTSSADDVEALGVEDLECELTNPSDLILGLEEQCQVEIKEEEASVKAADAADPMIHPRDFHRRFSQTNHYAMISHGANVLMENDGNNMLNLTLQNALRWLSSSFSSSSSAPPVVLRENPGSSSSSRPFLRIGLIGLSVDSTMTFLVYDLLTRCGFDPSGVAVCRPLVAGKTALSRSHALNQMEDFFGVRVFDSVGRFQTFLYPKNSGRLQSQVIRRRLVVQNQRSQLLVQQQQQQLEDCARIVAMTPAASLPFGSPLVSVRAYGDDENDGILLPTPVVALSDATEELVVLEDPVWTHLRATEFSAEEEKDQEMDREIARYLYRDSSKVHLTKLKGGLSGSNVFVVRSLDNYGQQEAPTVLKTGPQQGISLEKVRLERVASVLGNSAPSIDGYVELGERAGLRMRYATMGSTFGILRESEEEGEENEGDDQSTANFRKLYENDSISMDVIDKVIHTVFNVVLERFYRAATRERLNLFKSYNFDGVGWGTSFGRPTDSVPLLRERIVALLPDVNTENGHLSILPFGSLRLLNVANFLEVDLPHLKRNFLRIKPFSYVSFVHGDLHGRNLLLDHNLNVWLIDFDYTKRDHILRDAIQLETDILFHETPLESEEELEEAYFILKTLLEVEDLRQQLPEELSGVNSQKMQKAWFAVSRIRRCTARLVREDRSSLQLDIVMLRYALWALVLTEKCSELNRRLALAAACGFAEKIQKKMLKNRVLRVKWISLPTTKEKTEEGEEDRRLGITLLPGTRQESLRTDVDLLRSQGVTDLILLCTHSEMLWRYKRMPMLVQCCEGNPDRSKIVLHHLPIPDQGVPSESNGQAIVKLVAALLESGRRVVLISLSGLGRCGVVAACVLVEISHCSAEEAIAEVKRVRGQRVIENERQAQFVFEFAERASKA